MDVTFYGRLADVAGRRITVELPAGGCSIAELRLMVAREHPALADVIASPRTRPCIGAAIVGEDHHVDGRQAVEFIPPVSGG
jgi:molybdopterin converting factor small subunit